MPNSGPGVIPGRRPSRDRCLGFGGSWEALEAEDCRVGGGILLLSLDVEAFLDEAFWYSRGR